MSRMSLGCIFAGCAMLLMVVAALVHDASGHPVTAWWTIIYFALLTMGELLVIPVGLTLVDLLSPAGFAATAMGAWYIAKFFGTLLAGVMGSWWGTIPASAFFGLGAASVFLAAGILSLMGGLERRRS